MRASLIETLCAMALKFFWLDVFGEKPFSGNQLAVCMDAGRLSTEQMQMIAKETNFSETTFVLSSTERDGGYDTRIFTPNTELPFAGHPTLGTAWAIDQSMLESNSKRVALNLPIGQIPVDFVDDGLLWMTQTEPKIGERVSAEMTASAFSLQVSDIKDDWPIRIYDTGVPTLMIPLANLSALKRAKSNAEAYGDLIKTHGKILCFAFCEGGYESNQDFSARVFCDCYGVVEDPATGSANGCFAAYLANEGVLGPTQVRAIVGQGYEIGRPSTLYLDACKTEDGLSVKVGGKAVIVGEGVFEI